MSHIRKVLFVDRSNDVKIKKIMMVIIKIFIIIIIIVIIIIIIIIYIIGTDIIIIISFQYFIQLISMLQQQTPTYSI